MQWDELNTRAREVVGCDLPDHCRVPAMESALVPWVVWYRGVWSPAYDIITMLRTEASWVLGWSRVMDMVCRRIPVFSPWLQKDRFWNDVADGRCHAWDRCSQHITGCLIVETGLQVPVYDMEGMAGQVHADTMRGYGKTARKKKQQDDTGAREETWRAIKSVMDASAWDPSSPAYACRV